MISNHRVFLGNDSYAKGIIMFLGSQDVKGLKV